MNFIEMSFHRTDVLINADDINAIRRIASSTGSTIHILYKNGETGTYYGENEDWEKLCEKIGKITFTEKK